MYRKSIELLFCAAFCGLVLPADAQTIRVEISPGAAANSFVPEEALGAGIDRLNADGRTAALHAAGHRHDPLGRLADGVVPTEHRTPRRSVALESAPERGATRRGEDISPAARRRASRFGIRTAIPCRIEA